MSSQTLETQKQILPTLRQITQQLGPDVFSRDIELLYSFVESSKKMLGPHAEQARQHLWDIFTNGTAGNSALWNQPDMQLILEQHRTLLTLYTTYELNSTADMINWLKGTDFPERQPVSST